VAHPVNFMFALTFDEGRWELQTEAGGGSHSSTSRLNLSRF